MRIEVKPLSVNQAWQGRRFKTPTYKGYETECLVKLKPQKIPEGKLTLILTFGVSNPRFDIDNGVKPFLDILQKKYDFDDCRIFQTCQTKVITKKGKEFIDFYFEPYEEAH